MHRPLASLLLLLLALLPLSLAALTAWDDAIMQELRTEWIDSEFIKASWNGDPCTWQGVNCTGPYVTELSIPDANVTAPIDSRLWHLPMLTKVNLTNNFFFGDMPEAFMNATGIVSLDLSLNGIGPRLSSLCSCIRFLNISYNRFEDVELGGTSLRVADLTGNRLSRNRAGATGLGLQGLWALEELYLSRNPMLEWPVLTGSTAVLRRLHMYFLTSFAVQTSMMDFPEADFRSLEDLWVGSILNVTGSIPKFTGLGNLTYLSLSGMPEVAGSIPPALCELSRLRVLAIWDMVGLTGNIPASLTNLTSLESLWIFGNPTVVGALPNFGGHPTLRSLFVARNNLTGFAGDWLASDPFLPGSANHIPNLNSTFLAGNCLESLPSWCRDYRCRNHIDCQPPDPTAAPTLAPTAAPTATAGPCAPGRFGADCSCTSPAPDLGGAADATAFMCFDGQWVAPGLRIFNNATLQIDTEVVVSALEQESPGVIRWVLDGSRRPLAKLLADEQVHIRSGKLQLVLKSRPSLADGSSLSPIIQQGGGGTPVIGNSKQAAGAEEEEEDDPLTQLLRAAPVTGMGDPAMAPVYPQGLNRQLLSTADTTTAGTATPRVGAPVTATYVIMEYPSLVENSSFSEVEVIKEYTGAQCDDVATDISLGPLQLSVTFRVRPSCGGDAGLSDGAILGIVLGVAVLIGALVVAAVLLLKRRSMLKAFRGGPNEMQPTRSASRPRGASDSPPDSPVGSNRLDSVEIVS